jgi:hypothetical protein
MPFYEANEEPEITYPGSMHNAEIICTVRTLPEMIKARAYVSRLMQRAMQRLVCVRSQHEWLVRTPRNSEPNDAGPRGTGVVPFFETLTP